MVRLGTPAGDHTGDAPAPAVSVQFCASVNAIVVSSVKAPSAKDTTAVPEMLPSGFVTASAETTCVPPPRSAPSRAASTASGVAPVPTSASDPSASATSTLSMNRLIVRIITGGSTWVSPRPLTRSGCASSARIVTTYDSSAAARS